MVCHYRVAMLASVTLMATPSTAQYNSIERPRNTAGLFFFLVPGVGDRILNARTAANVLLLREGHSPTNSLSERWRNEALKRTCLKLNKCHRTSSGPIAATGEAKLQSLQSAVVFVEDASLFASISPLITGSRASVFLSPYSRVC